MVLPSDDDNDDDGDDDDDDDDDDGSSSFPHYLCLPGSRGCHGSPV